MSAIDLLNEIGRWSIQAVWLPLLVWTVMAVPMTSFLALTRGRVAHDARYVLTAALIAALPVGLLAAPILSLDGGSGSPIGIFTLPGIVFDSSESTIAAGENNWSTAHTAGLLLFLSIAAAAWRLVGLLLATLHLRGLRAVVADRTDSELQRAVETLKGQLGITSPVTAALSPDRIIPLTFGWIRPIVIIPKDLLQRPDDLRLALMHELIHIRRHDYAVQWVEHFIGALFVVHPLVALLRRESLYLREATCDAEVVQRTGNRGAYARLLYSFSTPRHAPWQLSIGIFEPEQHLRKRLGAMKDSIDSPRPSGARPLGIALAVLLFSASVSLMACSEQFVETATAQDVDIIEKEQDADVYVVVEDMPKLVGGLQAVQERLTYPESAKKAGLEGRVIVRFIVDENGAVQDAEILRGIGGGLDEAALNAVQQAEFEPGLQKGEPVKVRMSLPITFKLGASEAPSSTGAMAISYDLSGQIIRGRITDDATGSGIAGANVAVDGSAIGAATDAEGRFTLRLEKDARGVDLRVSTPGYSTVLLKNLK